MKDFSIGFALVAISGWCLHMTISEIKYKGPQLVIYLGWFAFVFTGVAGIAHLFFYFSSIAHAATTSSPNLKIHYHDYANEKMPRGNRVYVCHGSGCEWQVPFTFSQADLNKLRTVVSNSPSPIIERQHIANAIAWAEKRVCTKAGTCNDKAGASWATSKVKGQLECVDESINTTSYLLIMQRFLKHCKVITPIHRYGFSTFPHWAARINCSDGVFVVDSYFGPNGAEPKIMRVQVWSN